MYQAAVIADDFTSVTDCTISLASRGLSAAALLDIPEGFPPAARVIGLNTESRTQTPEEAYTRSRTAAEKLCEAGCRHIYKSVDSTLRGNLGAEIDGVMDGFGFSLAIVAPAFPHYGRTTIGGFHYLNGCLLENSYIASDPACPAKDSEIRRILETQSRRKAGLLTLSTVRRNGKEFREAVRALRSEGCELLIADAETEDDLGRIAEHAAALEPCLAVGSTGLIRHMADRWCGDTAANGVPFRKTEKGILVLAASVSPVTAAQIEELLKEGTAGRCLVPPGEAAFGEIREYVDQGAKILKDGFDLVFQVDASAEARERSALAARRAGLADGEVGERIVEAFSKAAAELLSLGISDAVVMTGGDMARAVLQEFGCDGMELYGEVEPGIPIGRLMGTKNFLAVTKAGAFGTPRALCTACSMLKKQ